jgi:choline-phosphate cytidylyltransferase
LQLSNQMCCCCGYQLNTVANAADLIDWVENADRWVSGFLEKFEEGCHLMVWKMI